MDAIVYQVDKRCNPGKFSKSKISSEKIPKSRILVKHPEASPKVNTSVKTPEMNLKIKLITPEMVTERKPLPVNHEYSLKLEFLVKPLEMFPNKKSSPRDRERHPK
ncbi:hypothetical protein AVEN_114794-1 [Araneus ventricosus]|uniref:Uncharacterized protein n=1 Tax=Araneus ventricosus TaxID=182803 RepID=A0A4Y2KEY6_ARAVE|nr:hypothetical protein AVEN_114794-1 [Araneus ventricosus]